MSDLEEQMIDLTIEALTGTVYDLCVSPFETILGIKMKIQRLEGWEAAIPGSSWFTRAYMSVGIAGNVAHL